MKYKLGQGVFSMENQAKQQKKVSQAGFYRLCAALLILGAVLLLRTFFPDQTKEFLHKTVASGMDYTAIMGDVGNGIRAFVLGVPHPGGIAEVSTDTDAEDTEENPEQDGTELPEGETYDPGHEPPPENGVPNTEGGIGGFEFPILWADANNFVSDLVYEDDTLPLPFGFSKPEKVDYTAYDLPFEAVMPAAGEITSRFGYRLHPIHGDWRFHYGVDIAGAAGEPITAFADGTVLATGWDAGYGNYLFIEHDGGFVSLYAHCSKIHVKTGQTVKAGEKVADIGSTGLSTGPHLHFELRREGDFLDPAGYLKEERGGAESTSGTALDTAG
jgi:murein DD-endopeptidase MepM/ murein hydrolase activator NlpD